MSVVCGNTASLINNINTDTQNVHMTIKRPFNLAEFSNQYLCDFLVCDMVNCDLPEVPPCEDGQTVVLKNPGECQPIHECGMTFKMFSL